MNLIDISKRVKQIEKEADDCETAHGYEDVLYYDFINYVAATGNKKLASLAKACLKTQTIKFPRHCA